MSNLQKTRAIVLSKINFGDTSKIVTLYTEDYGKETCIIKGGRSAKSKIGGIVDVMNHIEVVFYKKENREMQLISQSDLISHFPNIKQNLDSLKYAASVLELLYSLTIANEVNKKLYKGSVKILDMMNDSSDNPQLLFVKYFMFFLDELGYSLKGYNCKKCSKDFSESEVIYYNHARGFLCPDCGKNEIVNYEFSKELFNLLICLSAKQNQCTYSFENLKKLILFFEKFLKYHVPEFKGLKSIYTL